MTANLRVQIATLQAALAAPALPAEHEGEPIEWRPWEKAVVARCGRKADLDTCAHCGRAGPRMLALGLAGRPAAIRVYGHLCPACQEMRVYWRYDPPAGAWKGRLDLIAYSTPTEERQ